MRLAITLILFLTMPLALMGLVKDPYSAGYETNYSTNKQTIAVSGSEPKIVKDDIVLKLNPADPVDDPTLTSSEFGYRFLSNCPSCSRNHQGVDYPASEKNNEIYSVLSGVVTQVDYSGGYGLHVIIEHEIYPELVYETIYAHMRNNTVTKSLSIGDEVSKGQIIGHIGNTGISTGPHLHFEVIRNGKNLDPLEFFKLHSK